MATLAMENLVLPATRLALGLGSIKHGYEKYDTWPKFSDQMSKKGPWGPPVLPDSIPKDLHQPIAAAGLATQLIGGAALIPTGGARTRIIALPMAAFYGFATYTQFVTRGKSVEKEMFTTTSPKGWGVGYFLVPSLILLAAGGGRFGLI